MIASLQIESIEAFQQRIKQEFCQDSAIDPVLFDATVDIVADIELDAAGEPTTPIHNALNWQYTRFGKQSAPTVFAALLQNEDSSVWQAKLNNPLTDANGKPRKYEFPKGNSAKAFLPRIPCAIRRIISKRYGVNVPETGSFWDWLAEHPEIPIVWTEGGKKALALLSQGYVAIALIGVNGGYRRISDSRWDLIPDVVRFTQKGRLHTLAFDQDSSEKARYRVDAGLFQFGRLLDRSGGQVLIASWNKLQGKGCDDLIVKCGAAAWDEAYESAISFDQWKSRSYSNLSYEPDLKLNQRYLGQLDIPELARLIAAKSAKNTGKTESIKRLVDDAHHQGQRVLLISHRVQLTQALCDRVGIPSIYELKAAKGDGKFGMSCDVRVHGMGLCVDSLHPLSQAQFKAQDWADALIIIDEAEQVLWHTFNSSTCKDDRIAIHRELAALLSYALRIEGSGRVVLADADLTNVAVDFVLQVADRKNSLKPFVIVNEWMPTEPWQVTGYNTPELMLKELEKRIAKGEKVLICCDSQQTKGSFSTSGLEDRWNAIFPHAAILRIDSETLQLENHPAFGCISNLNQILPQYDIVLISPSIETGASLDFRGHFNSVWGFFWGQIPAASARQQLARLREPVERHIWCNKTGLGAIGAGETTVKALVEHQKQLCKSKLSLCCEAATTQGEADIQVANAFFEAWAKMAVRINVGMRDYRAAVLDGLEAEGHSVIRLEDTNGPQEKALRKELSAQRDERQWERAEAIADAEDLNREQAKQLEKRRSLKSEQEQFALAKFKLQERYGIQVNPELYLKDIRWGQSIHLHYYATEGNQFLKARDRGRVDELLANEQAWIPDVNRSLIADKVGVLQKLGVLALLNKREFREDDDDLKKLREDALKYRKHLKVILGIDIRPKDLGEGKKAKSGDSAIQVAGKFLSKLGFDLVFLRKEGGRNEQKRVYLLVSSWHSKFKPDARKKEEQQAYAEWLEWALEHGRDDRRSEVFSAWTKRHQACATKAASQATESEGSLKTVSSSVPVVTLANKEYTSYVTTNNVTTNNVPTPENLSPTLVGDSESGAPSGPVGAIARWGHRLGTWVVLEINDAIARIQLANAAQTGVWTAWEVPVTELQILPA